MELKWARVVFVKLTCAQWGIMGSKFGANGAQRGPGVAKMGPYEAQAKPRWSPMGPSGGKMAPKCISKSIDRSIPLPIACKCHFEATLELQKASKSASILDKSRLSTGATRHRGISENVHSPRRTVFFSQRSHGKFRYSSSKPEPKNYLL